MSEARVSHEGPLRIVALADLHCGHKYGLTPREWWVSPKRDKALRSVQEELFRRYEETIIKVGTPVDAVFGLGDFIAGEERANGGVELIEPDQAEQCNMAVDLLRMWRAKQYFLVRGSPYHGGQREEWDCRADLHPPWRWDSPGEGMAGPNLDGGSERSSQGRYPLAGPYPLLRLRRRSRLDGYEPACPVRGERETR